MSILEFLGMRREPDATNPSAETETETVRKIVAQLDGLEPERARFVAAFAYVLSRVAHADLDISADETREMERIVEQHGRLPEEQAVIVVQMAKTQSLLFGGTENFVVTRELGRIASEDEKLALLECLFAVSAADDSISTIEDNVIRQIATELRLEHKQFIAARSRFRDQLAVFKKTEKPASDS